MNNVLNYNPYRSNFFVSTQKSSGEALIELMGNLVNPVGLEIGTDVGETARYLLEHKTDLLLHCIDPYSNYTDWNGNNLNDRNDIFNKMKINLEPYKDRHIMYRTTSDFAVNSFESESFDFIFIDGLHEYDQVLRDCRNYYDKVKTGGLFSGHDFSVIAGVNKAVTEFAQQVGKEIKTTYNDVWYFYK